MNEFEIQSQITLQNFRNFQKLEQKFNRDCGGRLLLSHEAVYEAGSISPTRTAEGCACFGTEH